MSRWNLPSLSMPSRISPSASSRDSGLAARGIVAWMPAVMAGVTIMKMMSSTSITSIIGVTLMSAATAAWVCLSADRATGLRRLLGLEFLREDRPAELAADALDEVVDQLLGGVRHFHGDEVDLGREVVVEPHGRNGHDEAKGRSDQCLRDAARDPGQRARAARRRHRLERGHDTHGRPQQAHKRRRSTGGGEDAQAAL